LSVPKKENKSAEANLWCPKIKKVQFEISERRLVYPRSHRRQADTTEVNLKPSQSG
jgi:hypothetical protein